MHLMERGEENEAHGTWSTVDLLREQSDNIEISVGLDEADDGITLGLSDFHITNGMTGRAFHASLQIQLDREMVERLQAYLHFLLSLSPKAAT